MRRIDAIRQEQGIAMIMVVLIGILLVVLSVTIINLVRGESDRSAQQVQRGASFQAAEAGIDDYVAKLVDDRLFYLHKVHEAESTRTEPGGAKTGGGTAWSYGRQWTYADGQDSWRQLANGYEYNVQVTPPDAGSQYIKIVATGRKTGSTADQRVLETFVRPSSLADFYRVVNGDVGWGSGATTNGKIYANGNINHDGTAAANIYAEGQLTGSYTLISGAKGYDVDSNPNIRSQLKNPINFSDFVTSFVDIERASKSGGIFLDDPTKAAWKLVFKSNGTVDIQACTQAGGNHVAQTPPNCGAATNYSVPSNGAIYSPQTAIVSGQVKGRVSVASNDNIVVADHIRYETIGDDVLGLVAKNYVYVAWYVPDDLNWMAGVLAQNETWRSYPGCCSPKKNKMTFTGSSATDDGGSFSGMFTYRDYSYEPALQYLSPPWFPTVEDAYTVLFFRELPGT